MSSLSTLRGNEIVINSIHRLLKFYARRRKPILRVAYALIVFLIFNNGSKSKSRSRSRSNTLESPLSNGVNHDTFVKSKNPLVIISNKFKNSPFLHLFTQLNWRHKSTYKIAYYLTSEIVLVITRAFLTLKIATLDGSLVSSLIGKRFSKFFKLLAIWLLIGIPYSLTESLVEKSQSLLAMSIRTNITSKLLDEYLPNNGNSTIYQLINQSKNSLDSSDSPIIGDANHRLTKIVEEFSTSCSILPSQILTPTLDIFFAANQMGKSSENASEGALILGLIANVSTLALRIFTPNFSQLTNMRNALENKFHMFHSNIINHKEEIALAKGHRREIDLLDTAYFENEKFQRMELRRYAAYNFAVSFIFKYSLGAFGLMLCGLPTFTAAYVSGFNPDEITVNNLSSNFVTNRRLLLSASDSLGKLIQSKKNIQNMTGYANELWEFQSTLHKINASTEIEKAINNNLSANELILSGPNVEYADEISFINVPLITPSGDLLVSNLSFSIKQGQNLLIIGPNGCGKSSLFRILGGLWEIKSPGKLIVPNSRQDLFYLPQRSYFTYGTLREQIIYPNSYQDYHQKVIDNYHNRLGRRVDDEYLIELLQMVHLDHLLDWDEDEDEEQEEDGKNDENITDKQNNDFEMHYHDGLDANNCAAMLPQLNRKDKWSDALSVGEQQRLAMVRLYYHLPKFAVLDECTSWISNDLEDECYRIATEDMKITVISVCHRTSLWKFHNHILKFKRQDGESIAQTLFSSFDPKIRLERHNELIDIDSKLSKADDIKRRLLSLKQTIGNKKMTRKGAGSSSRKIMLLDD